MDGNVPGQIGKQRIREAYFHTPKQIVAKSSTLRVGTEAQRISDTNNDASLGVLVGPG
jgi:hypothetical protein